MSERAHRGTIHLEEARVLSHTAFPGDQWVLRLEAPKTASCALPGSFVHLRCDAALPMRRPLSLMGASPEAGWVDLLYKVVGRGTRLLSRQPPGAVLSLMGPIGRPFAPDPRRTRPLLVGGGVGIPPMVFLADTLRTRAQEGVRPLVLMGSEVPFPFQTRTSGLPVPGLPADATATMPLLESWGVPCRLASLAGLPGCHRGYVTDLARAWLSALPDAERDLVQVFACGPHGMLRAVARLARELALPCQVSLEEFMACAVGGCAGCVVEVTSEQGPAMKRVCVDGPVFDAYAVFPS